MPDQFESSELVTVVRPSYQLLKIQRSEVRASLHLLRGQDLTAPAPTKFVGKGRFSVLFAVLAAVAKYCDPCTGRSGKWAGSASP